MVKYRLDNWYTRSLQCLFITNGAKCLNKRQQTVLEMRFDGKTLKEVGVFLHLSGEIIRRIEAEAEIKLMRSLGR